MIELFESCSKPLTFCFYVVYEAKCVRQIFTICGHRGRVQKPMTPYGSDLCRGHEKWANFESFNIFR